MDEKLAMDTRFFLHTCFLHYYGALLKFREGIHLIVVKGRKTISITLKPYEKDYIVADSF